MDPKLIQKVAQVGSEVEVTLATGNQISGLLTEVSLDHITIDRKMAISVEAVIAVESLDNSNAQDSSTGTPSISPNLDNKVDTPEPLESDVNNIEAPEHDKLPSSESEVLDLSDVNTESADATPEVIATSESSGAETESTDSVNSEERVSERMVEIENRFNTDIQTVKLKLESPDLKFPADELPGWENTTVYSSWAQIRNKNDDVQNANELHLKHDTIQSILDEIKSLVERFPGSPTLKRVLAYFYSISEGWDGALQNYQAVAIQAVQVGKVHDYDWFNVAVAALALNKEEIACYSLGKFFLEVTHIDEPQAWDVYINLIGKFNDFSVFRELCKPDRYIIEEVEEEEMKVLLETAIYLLKKTGAETLSTEIMKKWLTGESENSLLAEAYEKLDGQPTESYRQLLTVFRNTITTLEKKSAPITPERPKHTNTVKRPISRLTQQKRKLQTRDAPGGKDPLYRRAERADTIDKNLEKAQRLYGECMEKDIKFESALKNRAMVMARLERYEEAENLLLLEANRKKVEDKQSVDRLLVNIYQKWGEHRKATELLNVLLKQTQDEDYVNAEAKFHHMPKQHPVTPERPKHTNAVKRPISQSTQRKQKPHTHGAYGGKGLHLYRQAERANTTDKDLEKAERLYGECMEKDIQFESALKDRAMVLARLKYYEKAENLLLLKDNRQKVKDKQSVDRLLVNIYQKWGQYRKAINLLKALLKQTQDIEKSTDIQWQIAITYLRLEDYVNAETKFLRVQERRPDNITVKRNIAVCLSKQREPRYDEAEKILNEIQKISPDVKTAELLEAIERAKVTGEFSLNEDNSKAFLSDFSFSGDASGFAQFFLKRCDFEGIRQGRVIDGIDEKKYEPLSQRLAIDDMKQLAKTADDPRQIGPRRPDQRTAYFLSAAKICDMGFGDRNDFYRYLCSSFASGGDLALTENLDTAQAWYREALIAYDKIKLSDLAENDANIAGNDAKGSLVRYLYAIDQPSTEIPMPPRILSIEDAVKSVIEDCTKKEKVFNAIDYLVSHSQYANQQLLKVLYEDSALQMETTAYLQKMKIPIPSVIDSQDVFIQLWKNLENKNVEKVREISNDLRVLNDFELSQSWLENSIGIAQDLHEKLLFELDKNRIRALQKIFETALDLCGRTVFDDRDRLCKDLKLRCQDLLEEIEKIPTNLSIKYVYSIIEIIQEKVKIYFEELYKSSKPELELRLAEGNESPTPEKDGKTEVQVVVVNEEGRMSAEGLKLVPILDAALLKEKVPDIELKEPLRGGKEAQKILIVPLQLTEHAIDEGAFSLVVRAEYRIPGSEKDETEVKNLAISLGSKNEFKPIYNPYALYANGQEVEDEHMFKGRSELIGNIKDAIQQSGSQSKCVLVYGQYRSGKSSVRLRLKDELEADNELLLVADLKDILLNLDAKRSVLCQILVRILSAVEEAVKNRINNNFKSLSYAIPSDEVLENHPDPQKYFEEILSDFKYALQKEWGAQQVVLLIDEFQHIYEIMITTDKLSSDFMRTWKGFLQRNLFSAVLVGQQVMAKFDEKFPNEFAAMHQEKVSYLEKHEARELIVDPIRIGGKEGDSRYKERAVEQILKLTASSPYYIQIMCNQLVNRMNTKCTEWVTDADVEHVAEVLIKAYSKADFHMFTRSGDESPAAIPEDDALEVLKTIAQNSRGNPARCLEGQIDCQTKLPIKSILEDLVSRDVVERYQGGSYEIKVGLFKEWLIRQV